MIYKPLLPIALAALLCVAPVRANTTDGLLIGGMAGLTAGFITSAIARHASHRHYHHHHDRVYVEQPTRIIERPVVVEQVIEHRPVIVEERIRPSRVTYQQAQPVQAQAYRQVHEHVSQPVHQPAPQALPAPQPAHMSIMERELSLKEQQVRLDLLKEENKKSELKIKELELELQLRSVTKRS